ncbi:hypothetical protein K0M31_006893, partial [Melipona bicolor]
MMLVTRAKADRSASGWRTSPRGALDMANVRTATKRAIRSNWESVNGPRDVLISERELGLFAAHDVKRRVHPQEGRTCDAISEIEDRRQGEIGLDDDVNDVNPFWQFF